MLPWHGTNQMVQYMDDRMNLSSDVIYAEDKAT